MLRSSTVPLRRAYDLAMLDLDGVVYVGEHGVPGAAEAVTDARADGMRVAFITNNASRPPQAVADHLRRLGLDCSSEDVVTSAQAAARVVVERHGAGATVVCLGGEGLRQALSTLGLVPVAVGDPSAERAEAVVTGYGPDVRWREIMQVAVRVGAGLPWVASNADHTIPTPSGVAPGHGVLVETIARFTGIDPVVAGKPEPPLLAETVRRMAGEAPLMVGDRLDTDIEGARRFGCDSLLVLTGVTGLPELLAAAPVERPSYLAADLSGLGSAHPEVVAHVDGGVDGCRAGSWWAGVEDDRLLVRRTSGAAEETGRTSDDAEDPLDAWRAAAVASWSHRDATGHVPDAAGLVLPEPEPAGR